MHDHAATGISHGDAVAFSAWRSLRDGVTYRLPSEREWEKAARGTDGRVFPWGDRFDPSLCHMRYTRPGRPRPAPVGFVATDESPYGVRGHGRRSVGVVPAGLRPHAGRRDAHPGRVLAQLRAPPVEPPTDSVPAPTTSIPPSDSDWFARPTDEGGGFAARRGAAPDGAPTHLLPRLSFLRVRLSVPP